MGERVISFNFDKKQAIVLCKKAISSKMTIIRDGGDALQCGAPPDITFNVLIKEHEIKISGGGPGAFLAETAANEIERVFQEYQRNPGAAMQQRRAPQRPAQAQTSFEQNESDAMTPEQYLAMLSKGADARGEEKVVSSNQSTPIASSQTIREEPSNSYAAEEPADFSNELAMESILNESSKREVIAKCEKMIRVSKIVCMVIFIITAFFSFTDIIFYFLGFTHGPAFLIIVAILAVGLSVPTLIFLIQKKLNLFAIFGFIMIEPAIIASADAISAVLKINTAPLWSLNLIVFIVFGIILLVNVTKLKNIKAN